MKGTKNNSESSQRVIHDLSLSVAFVERLDIVIEVTSPENRQSSGGRKREFFFFINTKNFNVHIFINLLSTSIIGSINNHIM